MFKEKSERMVPKPSEQLTNSGVDAREVKKMYQENVPTVFCSFVSHLRSMENEQADAGLPIPPTVVASPSLLLVVVIKGLLISPRFLPCLAL